MSSSLAHTGGPQEMTKGKRAHKQRRKNGGVSLIDDDKGGFSSVDILIKITAANTCVLYVLFKV